MKKEEYYNQVFRRENVIKSFIFSFFLGIASWPRLLIEVFLRKEMGERYFSLSTGIIEATVLGMLPILESKIFLNREDYSVIGIILQNWALYIFLAVFVYKCFERKREIKRNKAEFDLTRFTLSTGNINPLFYQIKIQGKEATIRQISIYLEPAVPFVIGLILLGLGQGLGGLLITASICYSISYAAAFHAGDNYILDKIDQMICNENLAESFVMDERPEDTKGFYAYGPRPDNFNLRRKVLDSMNDDEPPVDVY